MSKKQKLKFGHLKLDDTTDKTKSSNKYYNSNLLDTRSLEIIDLTKLVLKKDGNEKEGYVVTNKGMTNNKSNKQFNIDVKDLEIDKSILGRGASGFVQKAVHKPTGTLVALKSINIYEKEKRQQLKSDLAVLQLNECPFLVKFYGGFFFDSSVKLALEFMNLGSLDSVIDKVSKNKSVVPEPIISKITQQILQGLLYLHKVKYQLHRDIKPGNILINSEGLVKLTDFGISRSVDNSSGMSDTFIGTKNYMSPERILGKEYTFNSDLWSLGLVVIEMATGLFPYKFSPIFMEHLTTIINDPEPKLPNNGTYSDDMHDFVQKCLQKDPNNRSSVTELCAHPWILKYSDEEANIALWLADLYGFMIVDS